MTSLFELRDALTDENAARAIDGSRVSELGAVSGITEATELPSVDLWKPPGPVADAFFWDDADIIGIRGPVGSGKTTAHLRSRFRRAVQMPRSTVDEIRRYKVVIARETYRQLWATTIPSWWEVMPKAMGRWSGGRGDPVTHYLEFEDDWGRVEFTAEFMAFGTSVSEVEANIRGVQTTDLALEEADTVPVAVMTKGVGRINRFPSKSHFELYEPAQRNYGQLSASYNSPDEDNWTVRVIEAQGADAEAATIRKSMADEGVKINFYRQPGFGEPGCENLQNLGTKYYPLQIAAMTAEGRGNDVERLVYNRIGYIRQGDPVFKGSAEHPMYQPNLHRARTTLPLIPGVGLRIGLDQGYFGAAVIGQFIAPFQWRIYAELCFKNGSFAPQFGAALRDLLNSPRFAGYRVEEAWCDMAGNAKESLEDVTWMSQVGAAAKLDIQPQQLGGNRVEPRLAVWRASMQWNHFGTQGLLIDPGCKLLLRGLENDYVWAEEIDKSENRTRRPKKKGVRAADVIDAGGYMMLGESLPDGRPKTADLIGDNGGPPIDEWDDPDTGGDDGVYDFNPMEGW
ncbi:hypothetical protein [Oceaniglobus trochenteri]|uniref:hypothetical protein n=1 Tax=Oceaniglobus trochenteri TaxID=2763260 RepID=UPI001CFF8379|nr:hypothetical protein [Oceaniglobus trochenteri]